MKKALKFGLIGLAVIVLLVGAVLAYVVATFDPNQYKPQLIQLMKDKQQRTLKLDGDIKLTIFPAIGAKASRISLSEHNSDKEFAAVEDVRVSLALMPLLARKVVVSEVGLSGVKVTVIKHKDGSTNLDDLIGKGEARQEEVKPQETAKPAAPILLDVAGIAVEKASLNYRDEGSGASYALNNLNFKTGRIANGVPVKVNFDSAVQTSKPEVDIKVQAGTTLTFDLEKKLFRIEGLDLQVNGKALDISNLQVKAEGAASANLTTHEFSASGLKVSASGLKGKDQFSGNVDLATFEFAKDKISAGKLAVNAKLDGDIGKLAAAVTLQDLQGNAQTFKSGGLAVDADFTQPQQAFKLKLTTPVVGSMAAKQINLSNLVIALNATGDKLPGKSISSELKGSIQADAERESVNLTLAGGLLQSQVKTKLAVKGFTVPAIRFDVEVDQFDADPYLPKSEKKTEQVKTEAAPEQPFDLSALRKLNLNGSIRVGSLKVANVKTSKLRVDVKAQQGIVTVSPMSASLYEGGTSGSMEVNANPAVPAFSVKQTLSGVQLGPLIKDAANFDMVEGKANLNVALTSQGNTVSAIKKGLNGTVALNMANGAIKGINLSKLVHGVQNMGGGMETLKPAAGDRTEFDELKANFKMSSGVAHNDDLTVKSQSLRVTGAGDIDIGNSSINYGVKTTVADAVDAQNGSLTIPLQIQGPFTDLKFKVDYGAVVRDVAKQKIEKRKQELQEDLKNKLQEKLKGGLQGLFK